MPSTARMPLTTDQEAVRIGEDNEEHAGWRGEENFWPCMLMATLLFGPAVAKADRRPGLERNCGRYSRRERQNPFAQARFAAIVQLAVFEAVNAITGDYEPYLGTIVAPHGASADAAAIEAAYRVLSTYFPASASTLDPLARTRWL